jgi:electron transfer flavoprotein beta subunit
MPAVHGVLDAVCGTSGALTTAVCIQNAGSWPVSAVTFRWAAGLLLGNIVAMNIVVLIKQVPDTWSERRLADSDHTLDRASADVVLDEINERAVEEALKIKEAGDGEVTVVTMGPQRATDAIRKALSMGADSAVHLCDEGLHGSCAVQTAKALAKVIGTVGDVDLIIAGNEATDGTIGAIPAMVADVLGLPELTHARKVTIEGRTVTIERETDDGVTVLQADLPAVVSVNEKINEPRYPSFKGIMAAKKKPVRTLSLADAGIAVSDAGLAAAASTVIESAPRPPRSAGQVITDEGDGAARLVEYLISQKLI